MWRILRIALMWLLAVALPAQGLAAATMMHCGPAHHGVAHSHAHAGHVHEHAADGATTPDHRHHDDAAPHGHVHADAVTSDHDVAKAGDAGQVVKTSCSACASCCTVAALPSTIATFEASPVHDAAIAVPPRTEVAFLTGRIERPPRSVLA